jgi:hypothetical protein
MRVPAAGAGWQTAKSETVMASPSTHVEQLELVLLRRGLGALRPPDTAAPIAGARR